MKKQKVSKGNIVLSVVILLVFGLFLVGVMLWERDQSIQLPPSEPDADTLIASVPLETTGYSEPAAETTLPPETTLPVFAPRQINFLLIGRDWHHEGENGRSDTMILCSVDTGAKTVTLISFLRDMYVSIPGYINHKLNSSYSWGGYELLNDTLERNFGVRADVSLEMDFDGFESMIDYLGGVDIELTDAEANYLNNHYGWSLAEGSNHLSGEEALAYSRIRYLDSDFVRTQRQQNVLRSLLEEFRNASVQEMLDVTDEFLDQSTSSHTDDELLGYALELYSVLNECELISRRVPSDDTYYYDMINGMSVVVPDFEANRELLREWLGMDEA